MSDQINFRVIVEQMGEDDLRAALSYLASSLDVGKMPTILDYASIFSIPTGISPFNTEQLKASIKEKHSYRQKTKNRKAGRSRKGSLSGAKP